MPTVQQIVRETMRNGVVHDAATATVPGLLDCCSNYFGLTRSSSLDAGGLMMLMLIVALSLSLSRGIHAGVHHHRHHTNMQSNQLVVVVVVWLLSSI